ncbi:mannose-1-phosphate guanylyltransferase/mannose-6-phosphate isomerase [Sphingomonas aurantiaca]|uniref:mannose-1-phosphate guanylyltransferase n=1 Tax=Sphingomonas aurantiaca TaxID=185949 RepID=A0A2T5GSS6_9SPHN|nr:mannose-1-phosphate guanylyltransferase/mannose-6-phosphate isomerase [Sphingomonas aurantiaca]PTQ62351.1 mannose-1-phosphate guanylyltransferase/mannose-1-phosphate guanylyltransferase/mannose-6-phosphate isomerase [Sphingomonas aurantiaca]
MTARTIVPVILSGGSGTRLWPMSRPEMPKQMLALTANETMLQLTAGRTQGERFAAPIVVANARHADLVEQQLADAGAIPQALILEPAGRNTAPAIALAAIAAGGGGDALLVMPSDHVIDDVPAFHAAIEAAMPLVSQGWLVTFGIAPDSPEIGYGWIQIGDALQPGVHRVARFVEKPPLDKAESMLASGDHAWNGGMFLFQADAYLEALAQFDPGILVATREAMDKARTEGTRIYPDATAFATSPDASIDYAVMEKAERVAVVPVAMGWNDVGSWDALHAISARDEVGNAHRSEGDGNVLAIDTRQCFVRSDGIRVSLVGVEDLIVVASGNDVLIMPRGRSQEVKKLIEAMKNDAAKKDAQAG